MATPENPATRTTRRISPVSQHGTTVTISGYGVMFCGPSGSGKSDLALRLIDAGAKLIADDRTVLSVTENHIIASSPDSLRGKLEVRGLGIIDVAFQETTRLDLVVDLTQLDRIERLPEPDHYDYEGVKIPRIQLCAFEASVQAKLRLALSKLKQS